MAHHSDSDSLTSIDESIFSSNSFRNGSQLDYKKLYLDSSFLDQKWRREFWFGQVKTFATTFGLAALCIVYCILGGLLFNVVEQSNEMQSCNTSWTQFQSVKLETIQGLVVQASDFQRSMKERKTEIESTLNAFIRGFAKSSWNGIDCDDLQLKSLWDLQSSAFFCLTIITSVGYGYVAPATSWGRAILIAYAIIGMPLYLASLAQLGKQFARVARYIYHQFCCCKLCRQVQVNREAKQETKHRLWAVWKRDEKNRRILDFVEALMEDSSEDDSENDDDSSWNQDEDNVPVWVSLLILASVVVFGASIFSVTENWSYLDAAYFAFISTATIGFGDLIPGLISSQAGHDKRKLLLVWFFIVFGMSILSTCLQMIQEQVTSSVKQLADCCNNTRSNASNDDESSSDNETTLVPNVATETLLTNQDVSVSNQQCDNDSTMAYYDNAVAIPLFTMNSNEQSLVPQPANDAF